MRPCQSVHRGQRGAELPGGLSHCQAQAARPCPVRPAGLTPSASRGTDVCLLLLWALGFVFSIFLRCSHFWALFSFALQFSQLISLLPACLTQLISVVWRPPRSECSQDSARPLGAVFPVLSWVSAGASRLTASLLPMARGMCADLFLCFQSFLVLTSIVIISPYKPQKPKPCESIGRGKRTSILVR